MKENTQPGFIPCRERKALEAEHGVIIETVDYRGRTYGDFFPNPNPWGPGWVVYGRGFGPGTYCNSIVMVSAIPAKIRRKMPGRGLAQPGFKTKRAAALLAELMNRAARGPSDNGTAP